MREGRGWRDEGKAVGASLVIMPEFAEGGLSIGREMGERRKRRGGGHMYDHEWSLLKFKNLHF